MGGKAFSSPAQMAARHLAGKRTTLASDLLAKGRLVEAEAAFRENIRLDLVLFNDSRASADRIGLAETLVALGRPTDAMEQYRLVARYRKSGGDIWHIEMGHPNDDLDYALLLLESGREAEAVGLYHNVVNRFHEDEPRRFWYEPIPILPVFGDAPDPGMTVWAFTPARLRTAALLLKAWHGVRREPEVWDEIAAATPGWIVPAFYRVHFSRIVPSAKAPLYDALLPLATTDDERAAIALAKAGVEMRPATLPSGPVLRAGSRILSENRALLANPAFRATFVSDGPPPGG